MAKDFQDYQLTQANNLRLARQPFLSFKWKANPDKPWGYARVEKNFDGMFSEV